MKLFTKLFIFTSIPFALFMGLMIGFDRGLETGVRIGLFQGLFFGAGMALFLGLLQRRETTRLGMVGDSSPHQTLRLDVNAESASAVFARAKAAVEQLGARILNEDAGACTLRARVRASWKSFGEIVECKVITAGARRFEIEIVSRPRFRGTLIDYGKGRENVEYIAQRML